MDKEVKRELAYSWLRGPEKIYIDPDRFPNACIAYRAMSDWEDALCYAMLARKFSEKGKAKG